MLVINSLNGPHIQFNAGKKKHKFNEIKILSHEIKTSCREKTIKWKKQLYDNKLLFAVQKTCAGIVWKLTSFIFTRSGRAGSHQIKFTNCEV